jgi:MFS family permease
MAGTRGKLYLMLSATLGTTLEWYDFFVFASCTVLVFNTQFYAPGDPFVADMLALGTFAAGFLSRPLGGIVMGSLGDRVGRKAVLVASLLLMGVATFAVGLLPTYAAAGAWAPVSLLALRILQGAAVGGEATGALLMVAETMPAGRRGFWTSFSLLSGPLANVLAASAIAATQRALGEQAFLAWGWRLPFLLSALLVLVGYMARRRVQESAAFDHLLHQRGVLPKAPLRESLAGFKLPMLKVFLVKAAENTFLYLFSTFLLLLATRFLGFSRAQTLDALLYASAAEVAVILLAALLSDKIGRRPVLLAGLAGCVLAGFGLFRLAPGSAAWTLQLALLVCLSCHGVVCGAMGAFFSELFPTRIRYTGLSAAYQSASVFGGSIAPLLGTFLLEKTGAAFSVALYAALVALPALATVGLTRETRGTDLEA